MNTLIHQPSITVFSTLLLAGVVLGIFLALVLLTTRHGYKRANTLLAGLLIAFVLDLLDEFALQTGFVYQFPKLASINWALDLCFGPLTYLYTLSMTGAAERSTRTRPWLHLALPLSGFCIVLVVGVFHPQIQYRDLLLGSGPLVLEVTSALMDLAGVASIVFYVALSLVILREHSKRAGEQFSYREKVSLAWLRNLLSALAILVILYLMLGFASESALIINRVFYSAIISVIFGIGFMGIKQPQIFMQTPPAIKIPGGHSDQTQPNEQSKYENSALSESESRAVFEETTQLLNTRQLYRENDLSLPVLADELGLPRHYVSQAINQVTGSNFFDLINGHRIQYLRDVFSQHEKRSTKTILQHALDAGFNSKSAFYSAFKKHTGQSPRQFIDSAAQHS